MCFRLAVASGSNKVNARLWIPFFVPRRREGAKDSSERSDNGKTGALHGVSYFDCDIDEDVSTNQNQPAARFAGGEQ